MYYNKKKSKTIALLGVALVLGICGCNAKEPVQEEQKQANIAGSVTKATEKEPEEITKAAEKEPAEVTKAVTQESVEITQAVIKGEEGTFGETEPTEAVEPQPGENAVPEPTDAEKQETTDALKEMEPEELVLHLLTNAEGVHFTDRGAGITELVGYAEEKDVAYFIMKKQNGFGLTQEEVYVGVLNPQTGELLQYYCYGNTTSDAVMMGKETGLYILYATECRDFGLHSGYGGALLAKDGILTQIWPLTPDGIYNDDYWNGHTARLNGETLERYIVIVTEVSPGDTAISTEVEFERTITLDEILAGAV